MHVRVFVQLIMSVSMHDQLDEGEEAAAEITQAVR
jgi:hypothetical protein